MSRVRVENFTLSLDGHDAGPGQSRRAPMGRGGETLHGWAFATRTFRAMVGQTGGSTAEGDRIARQGFEGIGGGVATLREGFARRLIDRAHIAVPPVLPGAGELLWAGLDLPALGYRAALRLATPVVLDRT